MTLTLSPIATIHTPYKQKFAIPRQPGLVKSAVGSVIFKPQFADPNSLRGLEQFSHLWLIFQFHHTTAQGWSPMVRPPRLGGNKKVGVFATRSTFRPNNMGLSVVEFVNIIQRPNHLELQVRGMDLLDGTPIFDIKPYLPYADAIPAATGGFAQEAPTLMPVSFSHEATSQMQQLKQRYPQLPAFITELLAQDPRPAYRGADTTDKVYGMNLYELNIQWQVSEQRCLVTSVAPSE